MKERLKKTGLESIPKDWFWDGMTIAIGEPAPMALVRQIIAANLKNITVIASGYALDILIASGCVKKTISYLAAGGVGVPVAPSFRKAAESGEIEVWECEEGILTSGLEAAGKGLPFMPCRGGVGTSLPEINEDLKIFQDPFKGETLLAVPAIRPNLTLIHAAVSDVYGNVQHCQGPGWLDLFLCRAADRTIVQVESIISNEQVRANPWATTLADVDAVMCFKWGAHPFYSRGEYIQDSTFINEYFAIGTEAYKTGDKEAMEKFLSTYYRNPRSHADYLEVVGLERLLGLREY